MKLTTSTTISMLLAIVLAKTQSVEGALGLITECKHIGIQSNGDFCYNFGPSPTARLRCYCQPYNPNNPCHQNTYNPEFCGYGRRLALDESFWSSKEFKSSCFNDNYEAKVVFDGGHLYFVANPQDKNSKCPGVAVDNGYMETDPGTLAPHLSILDESLAEGLALDHSLTLGSLSEALSQMNFTDYSIPVDKYNLTGNNCATFLLHLCEKIGLDYHEAATNANIVNYVGKSLAADERFVDKAREAYLKENTGIFQQMKFSVWEYYVGDEGMARALVKNYMDLME